MAQRPSSGPASGGDRRAHRLALWWLAGALVMVVVAGAALGVYKSDVHLTPLAQKAAEIGGPNLGAHMDGRDVYLTGEGTNEDVEHAFDLASRIKGVRSVYDEVEIVAARSDLTVDPDQFDPSVTVGLSGGVLTLRGLVPDDGSYGAIAAAAERLVGTDAVRNRLQETRAVRSKEWLAGVPDAIAALPDRVDVTVAFTEDRVVVSGEVATVAAADDLVRSLRSAGIPAVAKSLEVLEPRRAWIVAQKLPDEVRLDGLVSREYLTRIDQVIGRSYGEYTLRPADVELVDNVAAAPWVEVVARLLTATVALDSWFLRAGDDGIDLVGEAPSVAVARRTEVVAGVLSDGGSRVSADIRVEPAAVAAEMTRITSGVELFDRKADALTEEGVAAVDAAAALALSQDGLVLIITARPSGERDRAAASERAQRLADAVRDRLVEAGLDWMHLLARTSDEQPPTSTEGAAAADVRIVFSFAEGAAR